MTSAVISGTGLFVPPHTVSNEELVASYNAYVDNYNQQHAQAIEAGEVEALAHSSCAFIEKASGIKSRYVMYKEGVVDPEILKPVFAKRPFDQVPETVEMAEQAAREALAQAGREGHEVDLVICAASNMQRPYPAIAVELQHVLGAGGYAYDMNVACSSATFAIANAQSAIDSGMAKVVLVVNPEFASPQLNYKSRDSHFIFGDVCTALVIEAQAGCNPKNAFKILGCAMQTKYSTNIHCQVSYTDHCFSGLSEENSYFVQEGRKVFKELLPIASSHMLEHLEKMNIKPSELKRLWLHQANLNMNLFAARKVLNVEEVDLDVAPLVLDEFGNTASAGSIIALHRNKADFVPGERGLLCSFGAGYSVGSIGLEKL